MHLDSSICAPPDQDTVQSNTAIVMGIVHHGTEASDHCGQVKNLGEVWTFNRDHTSTNMAPLILQQLFKQISVDPDRRAVGYLKIGI